MSAKLAERKRGRESFLKNRVYWHASCDFAKRLPTPFSHAAGHGWPAVRADYTARSLDGSFDSR